MRACLVPFLFISVLRPFYIFYLSLLDKTGMIFYPFFLTSFFINWWFFFIGWKDLGIRITIRRNFKPQNFHFLPFLPIKFPFNYLK